MNKGLLGETLLFLKEDAFFSQEEKGEKKPEVLLCVQEKPSK